MSCFDSVWVNCPRCGKQVEFQSKAGECNLHDYTLETVTQAPEVLGSLSRQTETCSHCNASVGIQVIMMAQAVLR